MPAKDTTVVRVPNAVLEEVRDIIKDYRLSQRDDKEKLKRAKMANVEARAGFRGGVYIVNEREDGTFVVDNNTKAPQFKQLMMKYEGYKNNCRVYYAGRAYKLTVYRSAGLLMVNSNALNTAVYIRNQQSGRRKKAE